ncbi:MAG: hypothetical protein QXK37_00855 [Candidatus Woesearchaeota archaeon]
MASLLIITPVEKLQPEINKVAKTMESIPGVYLSLNKTQKSAEEALKKAGVKTDKLFFIDCVTSEKIRDDVLHIRPERLDLLSSAVTEFVRDIKGPKFILIDAISTLLIYNDENKVAKFVKEITECADANDVAVIALSPSTRGEELLNKIFNFFDSVEER